MILSLWSLIPPLTVLTIALISRKMNAAFFAGIITAALVASHGSIIQATILSASRLKNSFCDTDSLFLYGFLITIGSLIVLFNKTGNLNNLINIATKRLKSGRQAEIASIVFSFLLFVDDYLSILTTGHIIQPLSQRFGIPRVKIAYLVHSLAGTVVILAPISSWVATITAQLGQAGISPIMNATTYVSADPFFIYLNTMPYMFYSFLTIISVFFIVQKRISYGPMYTYEKHNHATVYSEQTAQKQSSSFWSIILPFVVLLFMMIGGILYSGNFWLFGGTNGLIEALKSNTNPFFIMFLSAVTGLATGFIIGFYHKQCSMIQIPSIIFEGWRLMKGAIFMVFLSSTLAVMLKSDIFTGQYLASLFIGSISLWLLPALFFIVSLICALATGSAWGTFSLMLSIAIPMITTVLNVSLPAEPHMVALLFPVLGAIFSGAVCGDHISPISETTIMASTSCGTSPITHAYTQFPYAAPAIIASLIAFLIAGYCTVNTITFGQIYTFGMAIFCCLTLIKIMNQRKKI